MKALTKVILIIVFNFYYLPQTVLAQDKNTLSTETIYTSSLPSIMTLHVLKSNGEMAFGSAFLAIDEGIAVTAYHLIKDAMEVKAKFSDEEVFDVSGIIDKDETRDIALIRIKTFGKPLLQLSKEEAEIGSDVFIIGAPLGLEFSMSDGIISQQQIFNGFKNYQFTCPASPGNSGCPLISESGEILGVVSWQTREGQNLNFAIPSYYVLGLDNSLPTTPFDELNNQNSGTDNFQWDYKNLTKEKYVELLSKSLSDYVDLENMLDFIAHIQQLNYSEMYYHFGIRDDPYNMALPSAYHLITKEIETQLSDFKRTKINEPIYDEINNAYIILLEDILNRATFLQDAIRIVRSKEEWTPKSNEILNMSYSLKNKKRNYLLSNRLDRFLKDSTQFLNLVADVVKERFNFEHKYSYYDLGLFMTERVNGYIYLVIREKLAMELGLRTMDTILNYDTIEFTNIVDFKKYLYDNRGKEIKIKIRREGEMEELDSEIPFQLPIE